MARVTQAQVKRLEARIRTGITRRRKSGQAEDAIYLFQALDPEAQGRWMATAAQFARDLADRTDDPQAKELYLSLAQLVDP